MNFKDEFDLIKGAKIDLRIKEKLPKQGNYLPTYVWDVYQEDNLVGSINLRIGYNENIYYGGNIGYEIVESYRCQGFAKEAVKMILPVAKKHSIDELYISCNPENIASQKVINSLPNCIFIEKASLPPHNDGYLKGERKKLIYKVKIEDLDIT